MTANGGTDDDSDRTVSRRRFVAATGASGLAACLAGCPDAVRVDGDGNDSGVAEPPESEATVTTTGDDDGAVVTWAFEPSAAREDGAAIRRSLHDSGLSDDVEVELIPGDEDVAQRRAEYGQAIAAEESRPDLFLMHHGWVNVFAQQGQLLNLSELLSETALATVDEEYFDAFTAPAREPETGDLFGVPVAPDFPTMQYRLDLVEEAGYDPIEEDWSTTPMTWERWSNVTADVYDASGVKFGFTTQWDVYDGTACCTFNEVMSSWGGAYFGGRKNLFGPVGDRPITVDAEPVVASLEMMRKFVYDEDIEGFDTYGGGFTPADVLGWVERDAREPFVSGDAVMHRNWSRFLPLNGRDSDSRGDVSLGENLGTMPIPYAVPPAGAVAEGTGGTTSAVGGWHAAVNPHTENAEAVAAVLDAALDPAFQLELFGLRQWLPPRPALFDEAAARGGDDIGRHLETLRVAGENAMPHPATPVWDDEASVIAQQANRTLDLEFSPGEAMRDLKLSLEQIERAG